MKRIVMLRIKIVLLVVFAIASSIALNAKEKMAHPDNISDILDWMEDGSTTKIIFPAGVYNFLEPISLVNDNLELEGAGKDKTILKLGAPNSYLIDATGNNATIRNLRLDGNKNQKSWGNTIFSFNKSKGHRFENVEFTNSKWNAISSVSAYATDGLLVKNCVFSNIDFHAIKIFNRNTNKRKGKVIVSVDKVVIDGCIFKEGYETAISSDNGNDREDIGNGTGRRYTESTSLNGTIIQNCIFEKSKQFHIAMVQTADVIIQNNVFMGMTDDAGGGCQPMHFEQFTHNFEIYDNTFHMPNTVSKNYIYIRISGTEGHKRVTQQRPSSTYSSWTYNVHGSNERRASVQCATTGHINKACKRDVHAYGPRNIYIAGNTFNASEKVGQYLFVGEGENIQIGTKKDGTVALNEFLGGTAKSKKICFGGHDEGTGNVNILGGQNITKYNIDIKDVSFDLPPVRLKKPIILDGSAIHTFAQVSENSRPYKFDASKTEELRARDGLPNFFQKLKAGEDVKIGYIGGSITNGGLWRTKSLEWLKSEYPKSNITQVNAAIGGTGPEYGACRIQNHLLQHKPDMVFIEYRVNNGGAYQGRALEGLITQTWKQNPNTEICIVYTISKGMIADIQKGNQTNAGKFMEPVANHYGVTSIEFGLEVVKLLNEDKLVFQKGDSPANGKIIFSNDGTHPVEAGHDIYRDVLVRSLTQIENHGISGSNVIPSPSQKHIFSNASLVSINKAKFSSGWEKVDLGDDIHINDGLTDKNGGKKTLFEKALKTTKVGESFTLKWDGFLLGFTSKLETKGDIQVEIITDGGKPELFDMKSRNGNSQTKYIFTKEIESGEHTTTVKLVKLAPGKEFQIGQFLVVGE